MTGWIKYNVMFIPKGNPKNSIDTKDICENGNLVKRGGVLARWTTNFDCNHDTEWWYIIKDKPFEMSQVKSNYRTMIRKGNKYFDVKIISSNEYAEEIAGIMIDAYKESKHIRKKDIPSRDNAVKYISKWSKDSLVFGAFFRESGRLCGYYKVNDFESYAQLETTRSIHDYEKFEINAALMWGILAFFKDRLEHGHGFYILDGERSIYHQTKYQEYLVTKFAFRKAFCELHIAYNPFFKILVNLAYSFRYLVNFIPGQFARKVNAIVLQEKIYRSFKK